MSKIFKSIGSTYCEGTASVKTAIFEMLLSNSLAFNLPFRIIGKLGGFINAGCASGKWNIASVFFERYSTTNFPDNIPEETVRAASEWIFFANNFSAVS